MKNFASFWNELKKDLSTKTKIKNWTVRNGFFGEDFSAQITTHDQVVCITPTGSINHAKRSDFELVFDNWEGYLSGRIQRNDLSNNSFVTKYTISIIHQYLK
ncbi:MAG: hypothetical protein ACW9WZ_02195 [Nitrosopumilus sp.]